MTKLNPTPPFAYSGEGIAHVVTTPGVDPVYGEWPENLHPRLLAALRARGLQRPYRHQATAIAAALQGQPVVTATGTSSGKSLTYQVPVLHTCLSEPRARAVVLFPTKALAQDQLRSLHELMPDAPIPVALYDGDTPRDERSRARRHAQVILTNPDMMHQGILPNHEPWNTFFKSLRYVVVDEMHAYRGIFGAHVAWVLRRLLRLAEWASGRAPTVIATSATIADPAEVMRDLCGQDPLVVSRDDGPKGTHTHVFLEPPEVVGLGATETTARLMVDLMAEGQRVLTFCRSRSTTERVLRRARPYAEQKGLDPRSLESYRAGYTPEERRAIERAFASGQLRGLVSTNALELGVDIGGLDAVVINGWPGRRASYRQQSGRAGRSGREGLTVLVAHSDPLEIHLCRHPLETVFGPAEPSPCRWENPFVGRAQISCLAHERAFDQSESAAWPDEVQALRDELTGEGELQYGAGRWFWAHPHSPASRVNIRNTDNRQIRLWKDGQEMGAIEFWRALREVHEGAIYLHRGNAYRVAKLDLARHEAILTEDVPEDEETEPISESLVERTMVIQSASAEGHLWELCSVQVTSRVTGYRRLEARSRRVIDEEPLELPTQQYSTVAVRLEVPLATEVEAMGAWHGVEHALDALAPLLCGADRNDLGHAWFVADPATLTTSLYIFDAVPGGVGFAEALYERRETWLQQAHQMVKDCKCEDGCPRCILSPRCESRNEPLDKLGTVQWLDRLARGPELPASAP